MSVEEIIAKKDAQIAQQNAEIAELKFQLAELRRLIYGVKSERFVSGEQAQQGHLFAADHPVQSPADNKETISYQRNKQSHVGRHPLPDHLPVQEIIIEPEEDTTDMVCIGQQVTETMDYTPSSLTRIRYIRNKYERKEDGGIAIGVLPTRPIDKGIAEAGLLAHVCVSKYVDHLPIYRQLERFKRDFGWALNKSTVNDWMLGCGALLAPLYEKLKETILKSGYIQVDESPIKVLDKTKSGKTHQGYQWVYYAPESKLVLFNYRKGRGQHGPKELLKDYHGYLQCDGYTVYDKIGAKASITLIGCLAHARRKFYEAQQSDKSRSTYALQTIQKIYTINNELKVSGKTHTRKEKIYPLMEQLKNWVEKECHLVLPKSPIGKAMQYYQNQWPKLKNIVLDDKIELDNNLIENKIRPLALGRKNYLFAGSHAGAQRAAIFYSFMGSCKAHNVNPFEWLRHTLSVIKEHPINKIEELLPGYNNL